MTSSPQTSIFQDAFYFSFNYRAKDIDLLKSLQLKVQSSNDLILHYSYFTCAETPASAEYQKHLADMSKIASKQFTRLLGSEEGWEFIVPCPKKFGPGLVPYPMIIQGPATQGQYSDDGMCYEQETILYKFAPGVGGPELPQLVKQYPVVKKRGYGPIITGKLVVEGIHVQEPGSYRIRTCYGVYKSNHELTRRIVVESERFEVEVSYDNSHIHLGKDTTCFLLWVILISHI